MYIKKIKIEKFKSFYEPFELDFEQVKGLWKVSGSVGSGKTSIGEAILFSLFGTISIALSVLGTGFLGMAATVAGVVAAIIVALLLLASNWEQVKARIQMYIDNVKQFMDNLGQKTEETFQWMITAI